MDSVSGTLTKDERKELERFRLERANREADALRRADEWEVLGKIDELLIDARLPALTAERVMAYLTLKHCGRGIKIVRE